MNLDYENVVDKILCSEEDIKSRIKIVARKIEEYYKDSERKLLLLGILKGSVVFMADLMKELHLPIEVDFMRLSSYGKGAVSTGNIVIKAGLERKDLSEYNILIVEDILDTGNTLKHIYDMLIQRNPQSIAVITLLDKPSRRVADIKADYVGVDVPNEFVVGYGLDYDQYYRNLPYIGVLKEEVYEK